MDTLAELTLQLSRDITRNEHDRAAALAALEADRARALAVLPGAGPLLRRHAEAVLAARAARDETLLDVQADLAEAERLTADRRRRDDDDAEQRLREADDAAETSRAAATDKATAAFELAVAAIERRALSPGDKVLARADARRILDRAIDAARDACAEARLLNQDRLLDERRAAAAREMADSRAHRARATARSVVAGHVFRQAVASADAALEAAWAGVPGAAVVLENVAGRQREVVRRFDAAEAALRAAFRRARNALDPSSAPASDGAVAAADAEQ